MIPGDQFIHDDTGDRIVFAPRFYLHESSRYGIVVTRDIQAEAGPLRRSDELIDLLAAYEEGHAPTNRYASGLYALFDVLGEKGMPIDDLLTASVFTTRTVTSLLTKLRDLFDSGVADLGGIDFDVDGDGRPGSRSPCSLPRAATRSSIPIRTAKCSPAIYSRCPFSRLPWISAERAPDIPHSI